MQWNISDDLRFAARGVSDDQAVLIANRTLEPTQVAGFNQFFDDVNGTRSDIYGLGLDARLTGSLYSGMEIIRRDLDVPFSAGRQVFIVDRIEDLYRLYLYWVPHDEWAVSGEVQFDNFDSDDSNVNFPNKVETLSVPLVVRYFSPWGLFSAIGATWIPSRRGSRIRHVVRGRRRQLRSR